MNGIRWFSRKDGEMVLQHSVLVTQLTKDKDGKWINVGNYEWRDVPIEDEV